jgi:hypothetical protein
VIDFLRAGTAAALCTLGLAAQAQTFHAGIAGGSTRTNSDCAGATTCDKSGAGGRAWVGVTNKNGLGVEIVAQDFGSVRASAPVAGGTLEEKGTLRGIGIGPIWDYREGNWSFHARAGMGRYKSSVRVSDPTGSITVSDRSNDFYWGAGVGYRLGTSVTVIAAYDSTQADNKAGGYRYDAALYSLGVQFGF